MSEKAQYYTEFCNYIFTCIFVLEAIIKLIAYSKRYFKDNWNIFDFSIVASSVIMHLVVRIWNFKKFY